MTEPTPDQDAEVARALARTTHDGPGDLDNLSESDWQGYATEGVEVDD
jgi:hypothetical protein